VDRGTDTADVWLGCAVGDGCGDEEVGRGVDAGELGDTVGLGVALDGGVDGVVGTFDDGGDDGVVGMSDDGGVVGVVAVSDGDVGVVAVEVSDAGGVPVVVAVSDVAAGTSGNVGGGTFGGMVALGSWFSTLTVNSCH
jgi:hypothetical protein